MCANSLGQEAGGPAAAQGPTHSRLRLCGAPGCRMGTCPCRLFVDLDARYLLGTAIQKGRPLGRAMPRTVVTSVKPATMALTCLRWTCSCGAPRSLGRPHGAGLPAWPAHASVLDLNVHHRPPHTDGGRMLRSTGHTNPHPLHHQTGVTPTPASLSRPPQLSPPHEALLASSPRLETLQAFAWTIQPALSHGGSPSSLQAAEWGRSPSTPASAARTEGAGQGLSGVPGMKQACPTATYKPVNAAASCRGRGDSGG